MILVIYNTEAGKGSVKKVVRKLYDDLNNLGTPFTTIDITRFTKEIVWELLQPGHIKRVIICGGDGTVNRTVNLLVDFSPNVEIGIIPCGYGNLIAGSLDASTTVESFVSENYKSGFNEVKVGRANNKFFLNVASIGLTADTVFVVEKFRKTDFGSVFYRTFGGLITHILFFCVTRLRKLIFNKYFDYPSSITWMRTRAESSVNSFSVFYGLRETIGHYKSIYLPAARFIPWNNNRSPTSSIGHVIKHKYPFTWQIDGEPQDKTQSLKISFNCQKLKILTIDQDWN